MIGIQAGEDEEGNEIIENVIDADGSKLMFSLQLLLGLALKLSAGSTVIGLLMVDVSV